MRTVQDKTYKKIINYKAEQHIGSIYQKNYDQKKIFYKKLLDKLLSVSVTLFSLTTEKQ
ncbi:MAG: hypothetical protein OER82_06830 [Nitrosopumilus sp.]|nr:hypothetical protein [Nitrosopumilus sp.]